MQVWTIRSVARSDRSPFTFIVLWPEIPGKIDTTYLRPVGQWYAGIYESERMLGALDNLDEADAKYRELFIDMDSLQSAKDINRGRNRNPKNVDDLDAEDSQIEDDESALFVSSDESAAGNDFPPGTSLDDQLLMLADADYLGLN